MSVLCDICNGELIINAGGKNATCTVCGMNHSIERVREKLGMAEPLKAPEKEPTPDKKTVASTSKIEDEIYDAEFETITDGALQIGGSLELSEVSEVVDAEYVSLGDCDYEEIHGRIAEYIKNGPFFVYEITENVPATYFGAHPKCMPINFLFRWSGRDILAVALLKSPHRKHGAVTGTMEACQKMGIRYVYFYMDKPNDRDYVVDRISEFLGI